MEKFTLELLFQIIGIGSASGLIYKSTHKAECCPWVPKTAADGICYKWDWVFVISGELDVDCSNRNYGTYRTSCGTCSGTHQYCDLESCINGGTTLHRDSYSCELVRNGW